MFIKFFITIFKEHLCWLVKSTDYCHYILTELQTHTWTLLPIAVTSNTFMQAYLFFLFFFYSSLQNIIDFVSFAIPRPNCRRYCLIGLPDYSSSEWKQNRREQWQLWDLWDMQQIEMYQKYSECVLVQRRQQTECAFKQMCVFYWGSIITGLISYLVLAHYKLGHTKLIV